MKTSRIIALILAAVIAVSAIAMLTGCQKDDTTATTAPTTAPTAAATTAATAAAATAAAQEDAQNSADNDSQQNDAQEKTTYIDEDGYIDQQVAIANVRQQAGSGAEIISCEKGTSPEGFKAWVIVVSPITATAEAKTVTYYSGYQFCYAENAENAAADEENDVSIDEQTAIANVRQQAGSGAQVISCEKGTSPDGAACWVVVVAPVTASEEAVYDTYYSGYLFCYKASSGDGE